MNYLDVDMLDPIRLMNTDETLRGQISKLAETQSATKVEKTFDFNMNSVKIKEFTDLLGIQEKPLANGDYGIIRGFLTEDRNVGMVVQHLEKNTNSGEIYHLYKVCKLIDFENIISEIKKENKKTEINQLVRNNGVANHKPLMAIEEYMRNKLKTQKNLIPKELVTYLLYTGNNIGGTTNFRNFYLFNLDMRNNIMYINDTKNPKDPIYLDLKKITEITEKTNGFKVRTSNVYQIIATSVDEIWSLPVFDNETERNVQMQKSVETFDIQKKIKK